MSSIINDRRYGVVQWLTRDEATNYKPKYNTISLRGFFDIVQKNTNIPPKDLIIGNIYKAYFCENDEKDFTHTNSKYKVKLLFTGIPSHYIDLQFFYCVPLNKSRLKNI